MWFMQKIANPLVMLLLRSPLHGMMSSALLLLSYRGRKSGKEYRLPVQYVQERHMIYIIPGAAEQKTWWRNLRGGAPVRLTLQGESVNGQARVLEGAAEAEQITAILALYLKHFPALAKQYSIGVDADGSFDREALHRQALTMVVVQVVLEEQA